MVLGLIDAAIGIIVCIVMMIIKPMFSLVDGIWQMNIRFEVLFLLPYLIKCWKIKKSWEQFPGQGTMDEVKTDSLEPKNTK